VATPVEAKAQAATCVSFVVGIAVLNAVVTAVLMASPASRSDTPWQGSET